jgi:hypothetical protein
MIGVLDNSLDIALLEHSTQDGKADLRHSLPSNIPSPDILLAFLT